MACLALGTAAFAAQVNPPNAGGVAANASLAVNPALLVHYVGNYQFGPYALLSVAFDGTQLTMQLTGQPPVAIFPRNTTTFFAKEVDAQVSFVQDAQGHTTALVLHQHGRDMTAPRIDDAAAQDINNALAARVNHQQPFPGSEAALQILLSGNDRSPRLSPSLAQAMREQKPQLEAFLARLGPVLSHEFAGVTPQGWDKYLVRHASGTEEVLFLLDAHGTIVGALRRP
ncbi:hypothetical protein GCM10027066_33970 [Dyella jejuensis]